MMTLQSYTQVKSIQVRWLNSSPYSNQEVYLQFDYTLLVPAQPATFSLPV